MDQSELPSQSATNHVASTTETSGLPALEAGSPRVRCPWGRFLLPASHKGRVGPGPPPRGLQVAVWSLRPHSNSPVCASPGPNVFCYENTSGTGGGLTLTALFQFTSAKTLSPISVSIEIRYLHCHVIDLALVSLMNH